MFSIAFGPARFHSALGRHMSAMRHRNWSGVLRATGRLAAVGVLSALALVPDRFLPGGQGIHIEGTIAGDPIEIPWGVPGATPYWIALVMETGLCDIVVFDVGGAVLKKWSAQQVTDRGRIPPGGRVKLLARPGAKGYYHLRLGPLATWGPVLMATRVVMLGLSAAFVTAWLFGVRVRRRQWDARQRRVLVLLAATAALSGLVLYSIVHEAGHLLFGCLWGGTPAWDQVSWTVFSGEEPHASFRSLPREAEPWMAAGGLLLPSLVGCVLVAAGSWRGERSAWWVQGVLVTVGAVLLLGNLGLFADSGHTLPQARHFGAHGTLAQIMALMPAMLTLAISGCLGYRLRWRAEAPGQLRHQAEPGAAT